MLHQAIFNLAGSYAVTRRLEHIIGTALVPEVAVSVAGSEVTGAAPVTCEFVDRGLRLVPVTQKENRVGVAVLVQSVQGHVAWHTHSALLAFLIDHRHTMPWVGAAHAARPCRPAYAFNSVAIHGAVADDVIDLSLTKHLVHRHTQFLLAIAKNRVAHRFSSTHDGLQVQLKLSRGVRVGLHHGFQGRGKQKRVGHAVLLHQTKRQICRKTP